MGIPTSMFNIVELTTAAKDQLRSLGLAIFEAQNVQLPANVDRDKAATHAGALFCATLTCPLEDEKELDALHDIFSEAMEKTVHGLEG